MVPSNEVRTFRQLLVWQQAVDLSVRVHQAAATMPQAHRFELGRELRRSSISVPSNVAEGFNRHSRRAYRAHVTMSLGSDAELETQLIIAARLALLDGGVHDDLIERSQRVGRLLQGLWRSLE
jgi:four helix bundle protein